MAKDRLEQTESAIRTGVSAVGDRFKVATTPGQKPMEQHLSCDRLHVAREELTSTLIAYDALVLPGAPLMNKGIDALEQHEMPVQCKTYKPPKGPRITT